MGKLNREQIKMMIMDAILEFNMDRTQKVDEVAESYAINIERIVNGGK